MNLKEQLARLKKFDPEAIPLEVAIPEQISSEEIQAWREQDVRNHLRALGNSEEEIDTYLKKAGSSGSE